jgi:hypothetical protein
MTNGDDASQEARYDEIVNKLEALLQKHKGKASGATAAGGAKGYLTTIAEAAGARSTADDDIPTLTETVDIPPHAAFASIRHHIITWANPGFRAQRCRSRP